MASPQTVLATAQAPKPEKFCRAQYFFDEWNSAFQILTEQANDVRDQAVSGTLLRYVSEKKEVGDHFDAMAARDVFRSAQQVWPCRYQEVYYRWLRQELSGLIYRLQKLEEKTAVLQEVDVNWNDPPKDKDEERGKPEMAVPENIPLAPLEEKVPVDLTTDETLQQIGETVQFHLQQPRQEVLAAAEEVEEEVVTLVQSGDEDLQAARLLFGRFGEVEFDKNISLEELRDWLQELSSISRGVNQLTQWSESSFLDQDGESEDVMRGLHSLGNIARYSSGRAGIDAREEAEKKLCPDAAAESGADEMRQRIDKISLRLHYGLYLRKQYGEKLRRAEEDDPERAKEYSAAEKKFCRGQQEIMKKAVAELPAQFSPDLDSYRSWHGTGETLENVRVAQFLITESGLCRVPGNREIAEFWYRYIDLSDDIARGQYFQKLLYDLLAELHGAVLSPQMNFGRAVLLLRLARGISRGLAYQFPRTAEGFEYTLQRYEGYLFDHWEAFMAVAQPATISLSQQVRGVLGLALGRGEERDEPAKNERVDQTSPSGAAAQKVPTLVALRRVEALKIALLLSGMYENRLRGGYGLKEIDPQWSRQWESGFAACGDPPGEKKTAAFNKWLRQIESEVQGYFVNSYRTSRSLNDIGYGQAMDWVRYSRRYAFSEAIVRQTEEGYAFYLDYRLDGGELRLPEDGEKERQAISAEERQRWIQATPRRERLKLTVNQNQVKAFIYRFDEKFRRYRRIERAPFFESAIDHRCPPLSYDRPEKLRQRTRSIMNRLIHKLSRYCFGRYEDDMADEYLQRKTIRWKKLETSQQTAGETPEPND